MQGHVSVGARLFASASRVLASHDAMQALFSNVCNDMLHYTAAFAMLRCRHMCGLLSRREVRRVGRFSFGRWHECQKRPDLSLAGASNEKAKIRWPLVHSLAPECRV